MSSAIRQPLTTEGETTGSFPGRARKGPPGHNKHINDNGAVHVSCEKI
jgi:hypothetical protein